MDMIACRQHHLIKEPQLPSTGTPRPKKLRNDSSSMTEGIVKVAYTAIGPRYSEEYVDGT